MLKLVISAFFLLFGNITKLKTRISVQQDCQLGMADKSAIIIPVDGVFRAGKTVWIMFGYISAHVNLGNIQCTTNTYSSP